MTGTESPEVKGAITDADLKRIERLIGSGFLQHWADGATKAWPQELIDKVRRLLTAYQERRAEIEHWALENQQLHEMHMANRNALAADLSTARDRIAALEGALNGAMPLIEIGAKVEFRRYSDMHHPGDTSIAGFIGEDKTRATLKAVKDALSPTEEA
ncbi:MAG: hypothetical protein J7521_20140 [Caulobacter sp.]|nr:hypothetical protein [Caulobacter sp.]